VNKNIKWNVCDLSRKSIEKCKTGEIIESPIFEIAIGAIGGGLIFLRNGRK
jgi:hypothetical protein